MPSNDDLFAGLEVQGKLVSGGQPTVSVSEKSEPVDNSDLFEGLDVGKEAIPQVAPKAVDRGFLDVAVMTEPPSIYEHLQWQPFTEEPFVV